MGAVGWALLAGRSIFGSVIDRANST